MSVAKEDHSIIQPHVPALLAQFRIELTFADDHEIDVAAGSDEQLRRSQKIRIILFPVQPPDGSNDLRV
jgi:hypothetical protein